MQSIGLKNKKANLNRKILQKIFNKKEYEYLISQKLFGEWDRDFLQKLNLSYSKENKGNISISKPVYTLDKKFGLVEVKEKTKIGIIIFKKQNTEWEELMTIAPIFIQPKVKDYNYIKN